MTLKTKILQICLVIKVSYMTVVW